MRVQISHHPDDRAIADELGKRLWEIGVQPCRDYLKSPAAERDNECLDQALRKYDRIIALLSEGYLQDEWLLNELTQSLVRDRATKGTVLICFIVGECAPPVMLTGPKIDLRTQSLDAAFESLLPLLGASREVFVVMKFNDRQLDSMYEVAIKPVLEEFKLEPIRIDEVEDSGSISQQTLDQIERSAVVIADLTGERPNCYYEAGYAHALGKELIFTIRTGERIHFDLADRRFIQWETEKDLMDALRRRLRAVLSGTPAGTE